MKKVVCCVCGRSFEYLLNPYCSDECKKRDLDFKRHVERKKKKLQIKGINRLTNKQRKALTGSGIKIKGKKGKRIKKLSLKNAELNQRVNELKSQISTLRSAPARTWKAHPFYDSREWLELRYAAFKRYGRVCSLCGGTSLLHVDHIKPRSKYPLLELDIDNLQILCKACNLGKSNKDETQWRA
jgi:5-methylcytosine-specific restriction endonuclease McrA